MEKRDDELIGLDQWDHAGGNGFVNLFFWSIRTHSLHFSFSWSINEWRQCLPFPLLPTSLPRLSIVREYGVISCDYLVGNLKRLSTWISIHSEINQRLEEKNNSISSMNKFYDVIPNDFSIKPLICCLLLLMNHPIIALNNDLLIPNILSIGDICNNLAQIEKVIQPRTEFDQTDISPPSFSLRPSVGHDCDDIGTSSTTILDFRQEDFPSPSIPLIGKKRWDVQKIKMERNPCLSSECADRSFVGDTSQLNKALPLLIKSRLNERRRR